MNKKLYTVLMVLLVTMLAVSPVAAGGVSVKWGSGSITADGSGFGFSSYRYVQVTLNAQGDAHVSCVDPANNGNIVPGQNPTIAVFTTASAVTLSDKNGKFPVHLEAGTDEELQAQISPEAAGCPNNNWNTQIDWVDWTRSKLTVEDVDDVTFLPFSPPIILWEKAYTCTSTPDTVDCKAIK